MSDVPSADVQVVLSTAPDLESATKLVHTLVEERLAACGNVLPGATSIYRWEGAIHRDSEVLVVLKTHSGVAAELLRRAGELHPYDVPELLVLPVVDGDPAYLRWVVGETGLGDVL